MHGAAGVRLRAGCGVVLFAVASGSCDRHSAESDRLSLSPQSCNTECQARQTDCILECDGNVACEKECTVKGQDCVARCARRTGDAGRRSSASVP